MPSNGPHPPGVKLESLPCPAGLREWGECVTSGAHRPPPSGLAQLRAPGPLAALGHCKFTPPLVHPQAAQGLIALPGASPRHHKALHLASGRCARTCHLLRGVGTPCLQHLPQLCFSPLSLPDRIHYHGQLCEGANGGLLCFLLHPRA